MCGSSAEAGDWAQLDRTALEAALLAYSEPVVVLYLSSSTSSSQHLNESMTTLTASDLEGTVLTCSNTTGETCLVLPTESGTASMHCVLVNNAAIKALDLQDDEGVLSFLSRAMTQDPGLKVLFQQSIKRLVAGRLGAVHHYVPGDYGADRYFLSMRITPFSYLASESSAPGTAEGGSVFPAMILELDVPYEGRELAARLQRDYLIMSNIPSSVTMFNYAGRVLHQNRASIAYMGFLGQELEGSQAAAGAGAAAAEEARPEPKLRRSFEEVRGSQQGAVVPAGSLARLFALEPEKLEEMLKAVSAGLEWRGVMRMPPRLQHPRPGRQLGERRTEAAGPFAILSTTSNAAPGAFATSAQPPPIQVPAHVIQRVRAPASCGRQVLSPRGGPFAKRSWPSSHASTRQHSSAEAHAGGSPGLAGSDSRAHPDPAGAASPLDQPRPNPHPSPPRRAPSNLGPTRGLTASPFLDFILPERRIRDSASAPQSAAQAVSPAEAYLRSRTHLAGGPGSGLGGGAPPALPCIREGVPRLGSSGHGPATGVARLVRSLSAGSSWSSAQYGTAHGTKTASPVAAQATARRLLRPDPPLCWSDSSRSRSRASGLPTADAEACEAGAVRAYKARLSATTSREMSGALRIEDTLEVFTAPQSDAWELHSSTLQDSNLSIELLRPLLLEADQPPDRGSGGRGSGQSATAAAPASGSVPCRLGARTLLAGPHAAVAGAHGEEYQVREEEQEQEQEELSFFLPKVARNVTTSHNGRVAPRLLRAGRTSQTRSLAASGSSGAREEQESASQLSLDPQPRLLAPVVPPSPPSRLASRGEWGLREGQANGVGCEQSSSSAPGIPMAQPTWPAWPALPLARSGSCDAAADAVLSTVPALPTAPPGTDSPAATQRMLATQPGPLHSYSTAGGSAGGAPHGRLSGAAKRLAGASRPRLQSLPNGAPRRTKPLLSSMYLQHTTPEQRRRLQAMLAALGSGSGRSSTSPGASRSLLVTVSGALPRGSSAALPRMPCSAGLPSARRGESGASPRIAGSPLADTLLMGASLGGQQQREQQSTDLLAAPGPDAADEGQCDTGDVRWHEVHAMRCYDAMSSQSLIMVIQTDITCKVRAEEQLTAVLEAEHALLADVFPRHVVRAMTRRRRDEAELSRAGLTLLRGLQDPAALATSHESVTVLFADIKGFTEMSKEVPPAVVMSFLNDLYTRFDSLTDVYGVYKVETIGDCYMVAGGLMARDGDGFGAVRDGANADPLHAQRVVAFARAMLEEAARVVLPSTGEPVQVRVGIHSGSVVSGVVGTKMPRFCLFGDTINTASRMESTGRPGAIHASAASRSLLPPEEDAAGWAATGGVAVKGKGTMDTFLWSPRTAHAGRQRRSMQQRAMLLGTLSSLEPGAGMLASGGAATASAAGSGAGGGAASGGLDGLTLRSEEGLGSRASLRCARAAV